MQRYFIELAYNGTRYFGWQRQPNKVSVQEVLENSLSTILGSTIEIVGCGRTDTGVHAKQYFAHFDFAGEFPPAFLRRINKFLPKDLFIYRIFPVAPATHARFDAIARSYEYHLTFRKDPFRQETAYFYAYAEQPDFQKMQEAANLLLNYQLFAPFCKTGHDAKTMFCQLQRSEWIFSTDGQEAVFHITSNRFLRGMVRLIVGMCLQVGTGQISLEEVKTALENQTPLKKANSAPPQGLFLTDIRF
jgi:tRNA pseudouridine38-40 synthase